MGTTERHQAHDRLMADIRLSEQRLDRLADRARGMATETAQRFQDQIQALRERCDELRTRLSDWQEVEVGVPTAVADLGAAVDTLGADAEAASGDDPSAYQEAVDRQVRAWRSRVDHLRLQGSLGAMEVREDLESLTSRLDKARGGALVELQNALGDSKDLIEDLRGDMEEVLVDVRHAVERAVAPLIKR